MSDFGGKETDFRRSLRGPVTPVCQTLETCGLLWLVECRPDINMVCRSWVFLKQRLKGGRLKESEIFNLEIFRKNSNFSRWGDRKSTRLNSSHYSPSRMPSSA